MGRRDTAHKEIVVSIVLLLAAGVVLFKSASGDFRSMYLLPHVFAAIVSAAAIWSLLSHRTGAMKARIVLAALTVTVAVLAPVLHTRQLGAERRANERSGMEALGERTAPAIPYVHAVGMPEAAGRSVSFGGRVTLVNFWATWCSPCIDEIPTLEAFWQRHRDAGLDVLGVTKLYSEPGEPDAAATEIAAIGRFVSDLAVSYPIVIAGHDSPAHRDYRVVSMPSSVLIDRQGSVVGYGAGVDGTERLLEQARGLLEGGVGP